jgi:hypothetical protein
VAILVLILLIFALACFVFAAFWNPQPAPPRVNLIALGLAFWMLGLILQNHPIIH